MKTLRLIFIIAVLTLLCATLGAQTEDWQWLTSAGSDFDDSGVSIAVDALGNSYIAGTFADTTSFGGTTLISNGDLDIFIAKADAEGNWLWARQAGSPSAEIISSIILDSNGNVLITGSYFETAVFGALSLTAAGNYDIFVAKLDQSGNWLWASSAGGTSYEEVRDIAADSSGNAIVTGAFLESAIFGSSMVMSAGSFDMYTAKIDGDGVWQWCQRAGGDGSDYGMGIALDNPGNIYITGCFSYFAYFGTFGFESIGNHDIFAAKLDATGAWLWVQPAGGMSDDWGHKITVDANSNVFVAGTYRADVAFGSLSLVSITGSYPEVFVARIDTSGSWQWARQAGGFDIIAVSELATDADANVYMSGYFRGTAFLGDVTYTSQGNNDIFLAKLDSTGEWTHVLLGGGGGNDRSQGMCIADNEIYLTGSYSLTAQFGDIVLNSNGFGDIFVAKIVPFTPVVDEVLPVPQPFMLSQNYPNPFKQSTAISLNVLSTRAKYTLSVYDLRGRNICTLVDGWLDKGQHQLVWDGKNSNGDPLPSGVYYYKLDSGNGSETRRMILCK